MAHTTQQATRATPGAWSLARFQHGVVTRRQLLGLGLTADGIKHRVLRGRLHPVMRVSTRSGGLA